jgi:lipopolysaccharide/colanic/teichoic acid biosynthesis glycosyltransferase/VanZ family protein
MPKAVFDRCVSAVALVLLAPLLLIVAVVVRLDSPGPVLYRQRRVGRHGRPFMLLKFRSMVRDADRQAANVSPAGDPRVTRVGSVLRQWYVDELPQLVNVIKGDMSLVGPRPETPEFVERYTPDERRVLAVKPGVAGPSTLAFMDEATELAAAANPEAHYVTTMMHERVRLDLGYLERASLRYDIALLVQQVLAITGDRLRRAAEVHESPSGPLARGLPLQLVVVIVLASLGPDLLAGSGTVAAHMAHALAYAALTASLVIAWIAHRSQGWWVRALSFACLAITFGAVVEIAQLAVGRDAEWLDLAFDAAGALAVLPVVWTVRSRTRPVRTPATETSGGPWG